MCDEIDKTSCSFSSDISADDTSKNNVYFCLSVIPF